MKTLTNILRRASTVPVSFIQGILSEEDMIKADEGAYEKGLFGFAKEYHTYPGGFLINRTKSLYFPWEGPSVLRTQLKYDSEGKLKEKRVYSKSRKTTVMRFTPPGSFLGVVTEED
jgi:hypothetical protein